ncbi:MAG: Fic family protein [Candidatus Micrarchaeota archaeon]|nr:Fic family protein [Candidatus Micrarchaeota archaeon]
MDTEKFNGLAGTISISKLPNGEIVPTFTPKLLPIDVRPDQETIGLITKAARELGFLSAFKDRKITKFLIYLYTIKEAVSSSRIEGTKSSVEEILLYEAKNSMESKTVANPDEQEVINYSRALERGVELIKTRNIDTELILELHKLLMTGVRGKDKSPGEIRKTQNFIADNKMTRYAEASYIPPEPSRVPELLENLFTYLNSDDGTNELIKISIAHYQFEAIHPFRDGNGRIGRLLVLLYLIRKDILELPLLYLSGYFEKNRSEYYDMLLTISQTGDYASWIKFFLHGIISQSNDAVIRESKLVAYQNDYRKRIEEDGNMSVLKIFEELFINPYISISNAAKVLTVTYPTAQRAINILVEMGILSEVTGFKTNRLYAAKGIIDIIS